MPRHKKQFRIDGLTGPAGLVVAIIAQALDDALSADAELRADAVAYLTGGRLHDHLWAVGLNPAWVLPAIADQVPALKIYTAWT